MSLAESKSIFISYSESDRDVALSLKGILNQWLGDDVWTRDFDLNGGALIVEAIHEAIEEAKWFLLLVSSDAMKSQWLTTEANLATIRAIENLDVKIIIIKLDKTPLPKHLEFALTNQLTVDLTGAANFEDEFVRIAEHIEKSTPSKSSHDVYVDRGENRDEFALVARRNKVVFVLGWAGIGKTAFILQSVKEQLRKQCLIIRLTRGHSLDLLARQVLQKAHMPQPMDAAASSDRHLLMLAIEALKARAEKWFLFLDNAEEGVDGSNQLLPYLQAFLEAFLKANIDTHVVLATTRLIEFPASIGSSTDIIRLPGLDDKYIKESIDQWLLGTDKYDRLMKGPEIDQLVELVGGHPLAAKMLASFLKIKPAEQLLSAKERHRFELKLAQYVLRATDHEILSELHRLILQILATVKEPMLLEDMLAVRELRKYPLEQIHQARWDLANWFLIEQAGELMFIHNFLGTYYKNKLAEKEKLRDAITQDVGMYAYKKTAELNTDLKFIMAGKLGLEEKNEELVQVTNHILRYAIPAARLLRAAGRVDLAEDLPLQISGTLREMVFYYYQEKRDYKTALSYADKWLKLNPQDNEVLLQKARCYRNFRDKESLKRARDILSELNSRNKNKYFAARLCREKGLVAEYDGQIDEAKEHFRNGIRIDTAFPYIENYVGLATLLLDEAEKVPHGSDRRLQLAKEALKYLEIARGNEFTIFDRFHLGTYVEALIESGEENTAYPLLLEALEDRPEDDRLNYRLAEILRKAESLGQAEHYAREANKRGHRKASLSLANIFYGQAQRLVISGNDDEANVKFQKSLDMLATFRPEYGDDQEVADTIAAKIYRTIGKPNEAKKMIAKYGESNNPYTIYEQCRIDLSDALLESADERHGAALTLIEKVINRIARYQAEHELPQQLDDLLKDAEFNRMNLTRLL